MVKVGLPPLTLLHKRHPDHIMFIKSVTDFIVLASYHSHTEAILKYLLDALCGISCNIHCIQQYNKSYCISKIRHIYYVLHYIKCIRAMVSPDNGDTNISEAVHKNLTKNGDDCSNEGNIIPQILWSETHLFHIHLSVCILLHIIKLYPLSQKADICRMLLLGDSLESDKLSPSLVSHINRGLSKCSTIATLAFPEGISISEMIDDMPFKFSILRADMNTSVD